MRVAHEEGWGSVDDQVRLWNPRSTQLPWEEFPPFLRWRERISKERAEGAKSYLYSCNQIGIVHKFLEHTLTRFGIAFEPKHEVAVLAALTDRHSGTVAVSRPPTSLVEALLSEGTTIFAEYVEADARAQKAAAIRSFYLSFREEVGEIFPADLEKALNLSTVQPVARLPLFERYISERYSNKSVNVIRKDLRTFAKYVASVLGVELDEKVEQVEWRLSNNGTLSISSMRQRGPVTMAICTDGPRLLAGFQEHLKSRQDLLPYYRRDLFNATRLFLQWGAEQGFVQARKEQITTLTFGPRAPKKRQVKARQNNKKLKRDTAVAYAKKPRDQEEKKSVPKGPITRVDLLHEQGRLVAQLLQAPPKQALLGDLFFASARDLDTKRSALLVRSAAQSRLVKIEPAIYAELIDQLDRVQRSPFRRAAAKQYEGPLFVDSRGDSILSCNVASDERQLDLPRMRLALNLAHTLYSHAVEQLGPGSVSFKEILGIDLSDIRSSRTEVTIRREDGESIGKIILPRHTTALVGALIEVVRASELSGLWETFNAVRPLFMAPDGATILESLPGATVKAVVAKPRVNKDSLLRLRNKRG
ncbi:MAG: hypothetical protein EBZ48_05095 [Proteobacteria bacterium]|nr:hypothetical protein [Pseudomonadota bacterium]